MFFFFFAILIGNADGDVVPRRRKKDFPNESSKSANRSSHKEIDREVVKWESDGLAGNIVESPDGKLTVFSKFRMLLGRYIADE